MKFKSRRSRLILFGAFLLVAASGLLVVQQAGNRRGEALAAADTLSAGGDEGGKDKDGKEAPPVPVETALAAARDLPAYFNATGSIEARRRVDLIAKAQGQITAIKVEEGDRVREGQVLLELDHREEEIRLAEARVRAETAARELTRIQGLTERELGSERDFEMARKEAEVAKAEVELAQVMIDNKIVRAPFSGLIGTRNVQLGQTVNPGQALVGLVDVSPLELRLFLPEPVVHRLNVGQPVEIRPDVAPKTLLTGKVDRIAPTVDPATSTVKVTLRVDALGDAARVGSFVRARITTDVHAEAVAVPKRALVPEAGATYLFVTEADTVRKVPVTIGYTDDDFAEVLSGVALGERVVTVGQGGLRPGSRVRDLDRPRTAAPGPDADVAKAGTDGGSR